MRVHHHVPGTGADFRATDAKVAELTSRWAEWLSADDRHRIRLGLHELLVNIRQHAYQGCGGPIDILFTACSDAFRVEVTDQGDRFEGTVARPLPVSPAESGYGLAIVYAAFNEVRYERIAGSNSWALEVRRPSGGNP
jgi:anti-sigma regulatory factor (Ser/Thr protein kinase)